MESIKNKFLDFLRDDISSCEIKEEGYIYEVVKIPYGNCLDLLFVGYGLGDYFGIYGALRYSGIFDRETNKLYDLDDKIKKEILNISGKDNSYPTSEEIFQEINEKIQDYITNYVLENSKDFYEAVPKEYEPYITENTIYNDFINNEKPIIYQGDCEINNFDILLEYLDKGEDYLVEYALDYVTKYKESIGEILLEIDTRNNYLNELYQNKKHRMHKIKNIIDSLKELDCSTIHLFINKDGYDFNFKYDRDELINNYNYSLSGYKIPPSSRIPFEKLFGRRADFQYEDITKIEFRNKLIYEDLNFDYSNKLQEETVEL